MTRARLGLWFFATLCGLVASAHAQQPGTPSGTPTGATESEQPQEQFQEQPQEPTQVQSQEQQQQQPPTFTNISPSYVVETPPAAPPDEIRDPFKRPPLPQVERALSELETFAIEELKMTGVVTGPSQTKAMILAPNGKTYFVAENARIGNRKGIVDHISPEAVHVIEKAINLMGKEEIVPAEIKLVAPAHPSGGGENFRSGSFGSQPHMAPKVKR
jgi:Tfp pilus assembly protein PilP